MELLVRYLDRSNSVSSVMNQDLIKEENLRDDLKYYFMSPCEKYRARRHIPWKLGVQILKIAMITTQLILFGLNNQLVVSYKEENMMALKNLFLKHYSGMDEDDYSVAVYTQQDVYDSLFYVLDQYSQLDRLSVGPISYAEDEDGKLLPIIICKEYYKRGSVTPSDEAYDIDSELETVCMSQPKTATQSQSHNSSFFDLDFYRLVDIKITFQLKGINLQTVRRRELPDCYSFYVTITFDNQCHSGKVKISLDIDAQSCTCQDWKISGTAQKNTHYLLVFDAFVILVCLTSAVLCTRSIILAVRLLQRFSRFLHENYNRKVCEDDQSEFLNGWYVLVIVSDLLAIIGSILKMEIQAKSLTSYDVCSIFLGTSTLMVWVGVIRYLGYFQKYNVLILTMKAAFPKVLRFCCCAGMIYLGYTFCGWIVLGPYHEKFEGLSRVAECLFSLLNGDDMFTTFAQLKDKNTLVWLFSRAYLYSFISLFIYMVLSLFIALITDAYETIKNYQKEGFPLTDLHKFLREQKDLPVEEESSQTDVHVRHSVFCCCQRYDGVHGHAMMLF
ncbi:Mucolipin-2 Transient receptor potential channel mucolipin 2 [Larimichthys crocea]|uniref:Mucolipin-2 Transient receptor potential channel mucolipin 2 n=1 Tax=Larimichthys crocea TaxID=215358 RepID=A0A6G0ISA4_LARCR|nr:Mucolipin-2 Transient receptor potential channel mucolipin 2 [Larimichthys crocea]